MSDHAQVCAFEVKAHVRFKGNFVVAGHSTMTIGLTPLIIYT